MSAKQQLSITLPAELAQVIEGKLRSGAYATASDVVSDGIRALLEQDALVERWLRMEVVDGHAEYMSNPSKAFPRANWSGG